MSARTVDDNPPLHPPQAPPLAPGTPVIIDHLRTRPEFNRTRGTLVAFHADKNRYNVQLANGKALSLTPGCVSPDMSWRARLWLVYFYLCMTVHVTMWWMRRPLRLWSAGALASLRRHRMAQLQVGALILILLVASLVVWWCGWRMR